MAFRVRPTRDLDEFRGAIGSIGHYFGWVPTEEDGQRFSRLLPFDRMHAVFEDGAIVAGAGVFPFELTIPGGPVPCACVTVVGVLPTHRRRGLLTRMMREQLADARDRGEMVGALWASQETIYGRYGFGLASLSYNLELPKAAAYFRAGTPERTGRVRLVDHDEAFRVFPRIYDRVRARTPGMVERPRAWWEMRPLGDEPESRRGAGPLNRVLFEVDGRPAGYALYRLKQIEENGEWLRVVKVSEAFGLDDRATLELWRFLFEIDWTDRIDVRHLPLDHPLVLRVARINEAGFALYDALWFRVIDVPAALSRRSYAADGRVTLEVTGDPWLPENEGTWTVTDGRARRTTRRPDVRLDQEALGSAYLGGFTFAQLAAAGRVEEIARGGIARADAMFRSRPPWCPEIF